MMNEILHPLANKHANGELNQKGDVFHTIFKFLRSNVNELVRLRTRII